MEKQTFLNPLNEKCEKPCPTKMFGDTENLLCENCLEGCKVCDKASKCKECDKGKYNIFLSTFMDLALGKRNS